MRADHLSMEQLLALAVLVGLLLGVFGTIVTLYIMDWRYHRKQKRKP